MFGVALCGIPLSHNIFHVCGGCLLTPGLLASGPLPSEGKQ